MEEGMRVRVRGAAGGPTYKIQLRPPCRLQNLLDHLSQLTSIPASSLIISLNKRDPIALHDPQATLTSLGITSGDLLFYLNVPSTSPPLPHSSTLPRPPALGFGNSAPVRVEDDGRMKPDGEMESCDNSQGLAQEYGASDEVAARRMLCASAALKRMSASQGFEENASDPDAEGVDLCVETAGGSSALTVDSQDEPHGSSGKSDEENMEDLVVDKSEICRYGAYLIPDLLQRVLAKEEKNVRQQEGYLVLALHAVMLETGFVSKPGHEGSGDPYALPYEWSKGAGPINLYYTLPQILARSSSPSEVGVVILRCQIMGGWIVVYGTITGGISSEIHRLMMSSSNYLCETARANAARLENLAPTSGRNNSQGVFSNIFEFWKEVKDNLSLRLLADLCERSGLPPPPSFLVLPTELKMGILEMLPAPALARLGCVCTELRFFASNDNLWKEKYKKEFGLREENQISEISWKYRFRLEWAHRKQRAEDLRGRRQFRPNRRLPLRRPPQLGPGFGIIGGDYDMFPTLPGYTSLGRHSWIPHGHPHRYS